MPGDDILVLYSNLNPNPEKFKKSFGKSWRARQVFGEEMERRLDVRLGESKNEIGYALWGRIEEVNHV